MYARLNITATDGSYFDTRWFILLQLSEGDRATYHMSQDIDKIQNVLSRKGAEIKIEFAATPPPGSLISKHSWDAEEVRGSYTTISVKGKGSKVELA